MQEADGCPLHPEHRYPLHPEPCPRYTCAMTNRETLIIHADPEHNGIQTVVPLIFLTGLLLTYCLSLWLMPLRLGGAWTNYLLLGGCTAVPIAAFIMFLADKWLKQVWRSGQTIHLTPQDSIALHQPNADPLTIDLTQPHETLCWYYQMGNWPKIGRERQIQTGWYCHTLAIQQNGREIILFAFLPSRESDALRQRFPGHALNMAQLYETHQTGRLQRYRPSWERPEIPPDLLITEERVYWLGERSRWQHGRELTPADFQTILEVVTTEASNQ